MKQAIREYARVPLVAVLVIIGLMLLPAVSFSQNTNPGVLTPNSKSYGMSYQEWSARWWQWAVSMPLDHNPLADTADCSTGQLGPVWFLGGSFTSATAVRNCQVPAGKSLFFPIINVDCSSLESPPFFGATAGDRRACAKSIIDTVSGVSAEIDGVSVQDLTKYRATSPDFHFVAPNNNVLGVVGGGSGEMTSDGYYLLLAPLPAGPHAIHFKGTFGVFNFTLEITYYIDVKR
jgi:hypothetical protein